MANQTSPAPTPATQMAANDDSSERTLHLVRAFEAPCQVVYDAWTDPRQIIQWWGPKGVTVAEHAFDIRPGGHWRTNKRGPDGVDHIASGVYHELSPPERLVMSWAWESAGVRGHETLLTIEFKDLGNQRCELHLTQELFESIDSRRRHEEGWCSSFECLTDYLGEA